MDTEKSPAPRTPLNIDVQFRRSYARDDSGGILKNISLSGAFLSHREKALKAGEKLNLAFHVSGRERQVQCVVIWTNSYGSGIKFIPQNNRDVQIVDDLIYFVESKRSGTRTILDDIFKKIA